MTPALLARVMQATWPAARTLDVGPWRLRDGRGGGKRVSAATAEAAWLADDIALAETAMRELGQTPLFLIRDGDEALDQALAQRGWAIVDPVLAYAGPVAPLAALPPDWMTTFPHWPPLAVCADIWATAGIGPERLAVMERAKGPKCVILGRMNDRPAGAAFVAMEGETAMLHALEVLPQARRQGSAHNILRAAGLWAQENGASTLSLVVTEANDAARALYASLNMQVVGHYHYRQN